MTEIILDSEKMGAKVIIFGKILNSSFLKGLRHSAVVHPLCEMSSFLQRLAFYCIPFHLEHGTCFVYFKRKMENKQI